MYYLSQAVARQGEKGSKWMYDLKAVYGVFFLNFPMPGTKAHKLRTDIVLSDRDTHELFSDKMRYIFIELPSFRTLDLCVEEYGYIEEDAVPGAEVRVREAGRGGDTLFPDKGRTGKI